MYTNEKMIKKFYEKYLGIKLKNVKRKKNHKIET